MKNIKYIVLVLVVLLLPVSAKAEVIQFNVCFGDKGAYSISYDSEKNTEVSKNKINYEAAVNGHLPYPEGINDTDKEKYEFTASGLAKSCYVSGDNLVMCPSDSEISKYNVIDTYLSDDGVTNKINFKFNESTGNYTITVKDAYNDELYVRYVYGGMKSNKIDELNASNFTGQFLNRSSNGIYTISNVGAKTEITLEFYIKKTTGCTGSYIGYISFYTPDSYDYEIDNPALTNPNAYQCDVVKNYVPTGMVNLDDLSKFNSVKKSYINECYGLNKIKYGEKGNLYQTIDGKFKKLKEMFSSYTNSSTSGSKICTDKYNIGSKVTYANTGSYWSMVCTESYTASGDEAKLVSAGGGFSYQANYSVTRTCTITQINKPTKASSCYYSLSHLCSWPTKTGTGTGQDAGPTEDFDNCVNSCDGGKYTQECINACYSEVYEDDRNIGMLNKENKYKTFAVSTYTGPNTGTACTTDHGRPGQILTHCEHGVCDSACFSTWCGNHGGSCTFYSNKYPSGCVDDAEQAYQNALAASQAELDRFKELQNRVIPTGEYTYEITDSYLKTEKNKAYVFTVNSKNNPAVNIESVEKKNNLNLTSKPLGNSGGGNASYYETIVVTSDIKVNLPLAYIDKVNGSVVYKTSIDSKQTFSINHKMDRLDTVSEFTESRYYNGENKYYTSTLSDDINVVVVDDKVTLVRKDTDYNIKVSSSSVGGGSFKSDISCYYGVYNNFIVDDPDRPRGIQYIYRTIDLEDVFPNDREPRWNWTGTLNSSTHKGTGAASFADQNSLKYNINPVRLTQEIEGKGYTIYDVKSNSSEVDYEFVLTSENIRNIRSYNKKVRDYNGDGYNNYADYNMSCYKNSKGKEVCTSKFLDNISGNSGSETATDFITYSVSGFNIQARKNLAGCNNSKSGACVEIGS